MVNKLLCAITISLMLLGCARVPYTQRTQLMMISEEGEAELGQTAFSQIKEEKRLSADPKSNELIKSVGARIATAADKPDYKWEFVVIEDPTANAFALPGGKVAFHTGILPLCKDANGVAVVMGHEVAHVLARHGAERISQGQILSLGQTALSIALRNKTPAARESVLGAYGLGSQVGVLLPYSRKHETEADKIGLILMAKAGYDPAGAIDFWKRMMEASKGPRPPELLSTHPNDEKRIKELEDFLPIAREYYKK